MLNSTPEMQPVVAISPNPNFATYVLTKKSLIKILSEVPAAEFPKARTVIPRYAWLTPVSSYSN